MPIKVSKPHIDSSDVVKSLVFVFLIVLTNTLERITAPIVMLIIPVIIFVMS